MKNKRVIIAVVLLCILGCAGASLAYFKTSDMISSAFKTRDYRTEVVEVFESPRIWSPGDTTPKTIKVTNNGNVPVAVRISFTEEWKDKDGNDLPLKYNGTDSAAIIDFTDDFETNWTKRTQGTTDFYYYNYRLDKGRSTVNLIDSVTFNSSVAYNTTHNCSHDNATNTDTCSTKSVGYLGGTYKLTVKIETMDYTLYKTEWETEFELAEPPKPYFAEYITSLAGNDYINATDPDNNIRYIGSNPNNYVTFNNELWRIIGVFDGRVKLYRKDSLGKYSWDTSLSSVNNGYGINEWSQAKLMQELNGDYLDTSLTSSPYWYSGSNNYKNTLFDYSNVLNTNSQSLIDDAVWYLGSPSNNSGTYDSNYTSTVTPIIAYNRERSNYFGNLCTSSSSCSNTVTRQATWTGKVGLAYASDFAFATDGGGSSNRQSCMNKEIYNYESYGYCGQNSWMIDNDGQWFIDPIDKTNDNYSAYTQASNGWVSTTTVYNSNKVHPTVYLKSNVKLDDGAGTLDNPYTLSL